MAYTVAAPYSTAIRGNVGLYYSLDAYVGATPVAGAQDLRPIGGSITDTNKPGVRRTLSVELAPEPGLYDLLAPLGTRLKAYAHVTYTNRDTVTIPMGVYVIDSRSIRTGGGGISITAKDKWLLIQRSKFIGPASSSSGSTVTAQIVSLIQGALGAGESVTVSSSSTATVGALTWDQDREKAINGLAASIGAWVYFDRDGVATIASIPTVAASANWLVDASASGVLLGLDRQQQAGDTYNVVVVSSSAADAEKFAPQVAFDSDSTSPTYAGTDPFTNPATAGPFGISVKYLDTPTTATAAQALAAAQAELARSVGMVSTVSLEQVPNPAVDAFDVIDVRALPERRDLSSVIERHVADTVTHPLGPGGSQGQQIEGRKINAA